MKVVTGNAGAILGKPPAFHLGQGRPFADGTSRAPLHVPQVIFQLQQHVFSPLFIFFGLFF
jgi:hypothetical protein